MTAHGVVGAVWRLGLVGRILEQRLASTDGRRGFTLPALAERPAQAHDWNPMLTPSDDPSPRHPVHEPDGGAPSPTPATGPLVETALRAITAQRSGDEAAAAAILDQLCDEGRGAELPVERLIVLLKELWHDDTPTNSARARASSNQLARLVSACIVSYYEG